ITAAPQGTRITSHFPQGDTGFFGRAHVVVEDRDVADVVVTLQRGVRVTGRVVWEQAPPSNAGPGLIAMAEPGHGQASLGYPRNQPNSRDNESFSINGLLPGEYVLRFLGGGSIK